MTLFSFDQPAHRLPFSRGMLIATLLSVGMVTACSNTVDWRDNVRKETPTATETNGQIAAPSKPRGITADGALVTLNEQTSASAASACTILRLSTSQEAFVAMVASEAYEKALNEEALHTEQSFEDVFATPLTAVEADAAYTCIQPIMEQDLIDSRHTLRDNFWTWSRVSGAPFVSKAMEYRHTVVYANDRALRLDDMKEQYDRGFPVGATLAAVSFRVTDTGLVEPGPILVIEKMNRSFNSDNGNWRFTQFYASGDIRGITLDDKWVETIPCPSCRIRDFDLFYLSFLNKGIMPFIDDPRARKEEQALEENDAAAAEPLESEAQTESVELAPEPELPAETLAPLAPAEPLPEEGLVIPPPLIQPPAVEAAPAGDPALDPASPVFEPPK